LGSYFERCRIIEMNPFRNEPNLRAKFSEPLHPAVSKELAAEPLLVRYGKRSPRPAKGPGDLCSSYKRRKKTKKIITEEKPKIYP